MSNPLDALVPPEEFLGFDDESEDEEERLRRHQLYRQLVQQREQLRRQRRRRMARRSDDSSDESEAEQLAIRVNGAAKLTPNSDGTPTEDKDGKEKEEKLVKLDPSEIGMCCLILSLLAWFGSSNVLSASASATWLNRRGSSDDSV